MSKLRVNLICACALAWLSALSAVRQAKAATFAELSAGPAPPSYSEGAPSAYPQGILPSPYAAEPSCSNCAPATPSYGGSAQGAIPEPLDQGGPAMMAPPMPQQRTYAGQPGAGLPNQTLRLWTFGQTNSTTDPFNPWGLSTPYMFVPWSTPLSGWTNAQTWNWWRERSGALPRNW